ncbi:MAG: multiheme c-type cytochrome [Planctomycetota bacterium]|nr:multiheme c-type cytochrome [Planctomycetota bacterium]
MQRAENRKSAGWHWLSWFPVLVLHVGCIESTPRTTLPGEVNEPDATAVSTNETDNSLPQQASARPPSVENVASPLPATVADGARELPREALFVEWPKPEWVLMITGRQRGYLEPCGCAGLENQKGGLMRRWTLFEQLVADGWPVVPVDLGNQVRRIGTQAELKFDYTIDTLDLMRYVAVGFGPDDLRLSTTYLVKAVTDDEFEPRLFASANVALFDSSFARPYRIATVAGRRVGITSVLGVEHQQKIASTDVLMKTPDQGLSEIWPQLVAEDCDVHVLLAYASLEESRRLARAFPQFDVVVTAGGADEPNGDLEVVSGTKSIMIQTGGKGMYAFVVGMFDDPQHPYRAQRVPLDARFVDAPQVSRRFREYQFRLKQLGLRGLGLLNAKGKGVNHPSGSKFVGAVNCRECHEEEYKVWESGVAGQDETGPHAHATRSLRQPPTRSGIDRRHDPECLSCHATGWNAQEFFPYTSGFISEQQTPTLVANGCENCHGPGSLHVAAEQASAANVERERLRTQLRLTLPAAERSCLQCHDADNSPDFHHADAFQTYWQRIAH